VKTVKEPKKKTKKKTKQILCHEIEPNACLKYWYIIFFSHIRSMHSVPFISQKWPWVAFVPSNVSVTLWSISDEMWTYTLNVEIGFFYMPWVTLNFLRWPWETFVHKPLSQRTTSISDKRFRRYELRRTNAAATMCSPPHFFFGGHIKPWFSLIYELWVF
jgi:hypothetical protein